MFSRFGRQAAIVVAITTAALAPPLPAQDRVSLDCAADLVPKLTTDRVTDEWGARRPDSVFNRLAPLMRRNAWGAVLDTLFAQFGGVSDMVPDSSMRTAVWFELGALRPLFARLDSAPATRSIGNAPSARWQLDGDPDRPAYRLVPASSGHRITIDSTVPSDARRVVCWTAIAVRRVLVFANAPGRAAVVKKLQQIDAAWSNYADNGPSQLPWELFLNSKVTLRRGSFEPPTWQLVALHASPALEVVGRYPDFSRSDALLLEIVGVALFRDDRTNFVALSGFATATPNLPVGWGPMLQFGKAVKVGYAFRGAGAVGPRHNGLIVSADVFGFLMKVPALVQQRRAEALPAALAACARSDGSVAC